MQHLIADKNSNKEYRLKVRWLTEGTIKVQAENVEQAVACLMERMKAPGFNPELMSSTQRVVPGTLNMGRADAVTVSFLDTVTYIRLLSEGEFQRYRDIIPLTRSPHSGSPVKWWLDPCDAERRSRYFATAVIDGARIGMADPNACYGVRPVIEFIGSGQQGSTIPYRNHTWTILHPGRAEGSLVALCDGLAGFSSFSHNEPEYSDSTVQAYLDKWALDNDIFGFRAGRSPSAVHSQAGQALSMA